MTAGFVLTPSALRGLRLAASYWRITLDERVSVFSPQLLLANEALFSERVVRGEPSPADVAAGRAGPLASMDITRINFGRLETSGVDLSASYALESSIGDWTVSASATWIDHYETGDVPGAVAIERVGIASVLGTIPEWRGVAGLGWRRGGLALSATGRFVASYKDAVGGSATLTGRRVDSQALFDVQASWDADAASIESAWLQGFKLALGISNVFDDEPPFAAIGGSTGHDLSQGDLRQRFGYLNLSKRF